MHDKLFVSSSDGGLYDTSDPDWSKRAPMRPEFNRTFSRPKNLRQVKASIRAGGYAWPGGYPMYAVPLTGGCFCFACLTREFRQIVEAYNREWENWDWQIGEICINYEDPDLFCDNCGERIESAYAEDSVEA